MTKVNYSFSSSDIKAITRVFESLSEYLSDSFESDQEENTFFTRIENAGVHLLSHKALTDDDISIIASSVHIACQALRYEIDMAPKLLRHFESYSKNLKKLELAFRPVFDSIVRNIEE